MIRRNYNSEFLGYDIFWGLITIILNAKGVVISFWIGDFIRGGISKFRSIYFGYIDLWIKNKQVIDSGQRGYDNIPSRFPTNPIVFIGWIYGNPHDKAILRGLGVRGKMKWKLSNSRKSDTVCAQHKIGIFEQCMITMDVAKKLKNKYLAFTPGTFTGIDENDNQTVQQSLWLGKYDNC